MKKIIKRILEKNPLLYNVALKLKTFSPSSIKNSLDRSQYRSRFGGCWPDRKDFQSILQAKSRANELTVEDAKRFEIWVKNGYIIFEGAIPTNIIDELNKELKDLKENPDATVKITGNFEGAKGYDPELVTRKNSVRIVDFYARSQAAREIILNENITRFLTLLFEESPLVFQGLNFEYGSQQNIHQDTAYVVANEPMKLAAAWVALEDVTEGSGELIYYEGSHFLPEFFFSKYFKHYNLQRDGDNQHIEWQELLHTNSKKLNFPLRRFLPKKGDVLIWHADLAHGGATITNDKTRRSFVGHFCPKSTNPFYFNYLEKNKAKVKFKNGYYASAHYEVHE